MPQAELEKSEPGDMEARPIAPMKSRRNFSPAEKVAILREHLIERVPISDLCDKHGIYPTLFYQWQKTFFENGEAAFQRSPRTENNRHQLRIDALESV